MNSTDKTVLAVDIGTSSARAMIFDSTGKILNTAQTQYGVLNPEPGFEEQNPEVLLAAVFSTIGECLALAETDCVGAISFSSQMYGIFPVDKDGKCLGNNIIWSDSRSIPQEEEIKALYDSKDLYRVTGCPVNSIYPLAKLLWIKQNNPTVFENTAYFVSIKDFVIFALTGQWITDYSMASSTGFFDITNLRWYQKALDIIGIEASNLPTPFAFDQSVLLSNEPLRKSWHLSDTVRIFPGSGDGPLANIGSGAWQTGSINIDLGTSGAVRVVLDHTPQECESGLWCYCMANNRWAYGGILTNVGNAYRWLAENLAFYAVEKKPIDLFARLEEVAKNCPAGAEGLFFLPYLRTPRSPYWDSSMKGILYGLRPNHTLAHITHALIEAIAYDLGTIIDSMDKQTKSKNSLLLTGGLSHSAFICQKLADVLDREIEVPSCSEGSIKGAAILGFKGLGLIENLSFSSEESNFTRKYKPNVENVRIFQKLRIEYSSLVTSFRKMHI